MTPSPEQIAEWSASFESWFISESTSISVDRNLLKAHGWNGYLRARTEQATEIAALKAEIDLLLPLAKFGAMVSRDKSKGSIDKRELLQYAILADVITPAVEATITQLLKD